MPFQNFSLEIQNLKLLLLLCCQRFCYDFDLFRIKAEGMERGNFRWISIISLFDNNYEFRLTDDGEFDQRQEKKQKDVRNHHTVTSPKIKSKFVR